MTNQDLAKLIEQNRQESVSGLHALQIQISDNDIKYDKKFEKIQTRLDVTSGVYRAALWVAGVLIALGSAIATYIGVNHR